MIHLVQEVERLLAAGVKGAEIGIIYKENRYGDHLAEYLRLKGLPFYTKRSLNILDQPLVQQLLTVLEWLVAEHDIPYSGDELLFEILHLEWWGIPPIEIARASVQVSELGYKERAKASLRQWLCAEAAKGPKDLFDAGMNPKMCEAIATLERLVGAVPNLTLQGLLEKVIREGGFLSHIMNSPDKNWLLQVITGFYNHVKEETHRHPLLQLTEFMNRIGLMQKEGIVLPLVQVAGNEKGVNLMTAHGSKGLEFDHVFVVGCTSSVWEKKRKPSNGFSFPDTLFLSSARGNDLEELRRLFYVALTRAKKHLYISFPNYTNEGKPLEPSMFVAEMAEGTELPREKIRIDGEAVAEFSALQLTAPVAPEVAHLDEELTDRLIGSFVMNVSALNNYLSCPLEFYFRNIVRIPSPRNEAMEFGSAVHHALEMLFRTMREKDNRFPPLEDFLNDFTWYMKRHRECFTKEQFARRMEYGVEILTNYYNYAIGSANKMVQIEYNVKNVVVEGIPLKGKLDKIEFNGKEVTIVDYKTGDPEKAREKLARPNPKNAAGGDYWRQAVFYKIMLDHLPGKDWKVEAVAFDFVEPTKKKEYVKERVVINEMDVQDVLAQIRAVSQKIQAKDFYTGCGDEDCHWCRFVKTNKLAVALHELQEEEAEDKRFALRVS
jgi:DNA helicase II / ATP-dependent DNA helicase PcrA